MKAEPNVNQSYIREIDGIRAFAVLVVVLYHMGLDRFSGGYIGVDVFFVLSGFLITRILVQQLSIGSFYFKSFYAKRAMRLFPALFYTIMVSCVASIFLLDVHVNYAFLESVPFAITSLSNFYFFSLSDYFDSEAITKPLLHTWSLGVEEQFYLLWPIVLWLTYRRLLLAVIVLGLLSLVLNLLYIEDNASAVFYMMPFRIFQFAVGGGLALVWASVGTSRVFSDLTLLLSLSILGYAVLTYSDATIFPGINAVPVTVAAAAAIVACKNARLGSLVFGNAVACHLGKISYSIYLTHWPIIVFYSAFKDFSPEDFLVHDIVIVLGLVYACALCMFYLVENNFRKAKLSIKASVLALVLPLAILPAFYFLSPLEKKGDFYEERAIDFHISPDIYKEYAYQRIRELATVGDFEADENKIKILVIGDSQAGDFINILEASRDSGIFDIRSHLLGARCQIVLGDSDRYRAHVGEKDRKLCKRQRIQVLDSKLIESSDVVVLGSSWRPWAIEELDRTVAHLEQRGASNILVVGLKNQAKSGYSLESMSLAYKEKKALLFEKRSGLVYQLEKRVIDMGKKVRYLDLISVVCSEVSKECEFLTSEGNIIFFDKNHITFKGSQYFAEELDRTGGLLPLLATDK